MEWSDSEAEELVRWADELEKKASYWVWGRWVICLMLIVLGATISYELTEIDKLQDFNIAQNLPGSGTVPEAQIGNYIDARIDLIRAEEQIERAILVQALIGGLLLGIILVDWRRGNRYRLKSKLLRKIYRGN